MVKIWYEDKKCKFRRSLLSIVVIHFCPTSSYASEVLAVVILSVHLSVYLWVKRVLCDKTKQCTGNILIPHERAITLVF